MCDCGKVVTQSECDLIRAHLNIEGFNGFCIYYFRGDELLFACVKKGDNPNTVALKYNFVDEEGNAKWFYVKEHPCLKL